MGGKLYSGPTERHLAEASTLQGCPREVLSPKRGVGVRVGPINPRNTGGSGVEGRESPTKGGVLPGIPAHGRQESFVARLVEMTVLRIVSMLIPATSKARVRRSGISPLHLAAERNRDNILELLIESGFDVNAMLSEDRSTMYEDHRSTALYFAVINNNIKATRMLLQAGADPNLDTFSPLLIALRQGCMKTVILLVEHGANVNAYIPMHPTTFPATVMFCMKYLIMLKYLMDNGCDALSCFSCVYGSNPHPPLKTSQSERSRYRDDQPTSHNTCVQFCEIVSMDMYSHWAGPIIDVLLDYVGDVNLCSRLIEHLDSYPDWASIKEKARSLCLSQVSLGIKAGYTLDGVPTHHRDESSSEKKGKMRSCSPCPSCNQQLCGVLELIHTFSLDS
ncbi:hypothetical protein QTP70_012491 [Hemibagrus guttatus]|uniref:Ankyrin repeat and SOCS box containing 2a, tandem duplicate 1 n=1 Tax=Hemibagrus guttatus TaxID=175788 RepID=A0AAE0UT70_9TELE|nr:hypothetical protein QTP70_012491 [Hemibagrus guttatus]